MPPSADAPADVRPIRRLVARAALLLRVSWGVTGVGLALGVALAATVAVLAADMLAPLPVALRCVALALVALPTAFVAVLGVLVPLGRRLGPLETARRIERRVPGMHSRLVSVVDIADHAAAQTSPAFFRRLMGEVTERLSGFRAGTVVDRRSVVRALGFCAAAAALLAGLYLAAPPRVRTAIRRVALPFADIPPYSSVGYAVSPGTTKVLKGEEVTFAATVERGEPDALAVELTSPDGAKTLRFDLKPEGAVWSAARDTASLGTGFESGFSYRVVGGGTWSVRHSVELLERPVILSARAAVLHPEYMAIPAPLTAKGDGDVSGPEGGSVEVSVEASGSVSEQEIQLVELATREVPVRGAAPARVWFDGALPAGAKADAAWQWRDNDLGRARTHAHPQHSGAQTHSLTADGTPFAVARGEQIVVEAYLDPQRVPEALMLSFRDEAGSWEHRAFWGTDKLPFGTTGTASRMGLGPVGVDWPGRWVTLRVPAAAVALEGKGLTGIGFTTLGGRVAWGPAVRVGPPATRVVTEPRVAARFPMTRPEPGVNRFVGRFPLSGAGLYRVELRNELGHANQAQREARFAATPDRAPEVILEQPGADLTLSTPTPVPLSLIARDDYGLKEVWLSVQREGEGRYTRTTKLSEYGVPDPKRADTLAAKLDAAALGLAAGKSLRYRVEAIDRKPGRDWVVSKDYLLRIADDGSAADRQLADFLQAQDPFREKLAQLIAKQKAVREKVEAAEKRFDPLQDKIEAMQRADALKADPAKTPPAARAEPARQPLAPEQVARLSPDEQRQLNDLRKELAELEAQQNQAEHAAQQLTGELKTLADRAEALPLAGKEVADGFRDVQGQFQSRAITPLAELVGEFRKGANAANAPTDLDAAADKAAGVQRDLESIQRQLGALNDAQRQAAQNPQAAADALRDAMNRERAGANAQELADLKAFLQGLKEQLQQGQRDQDTLAGAAEAAAPPEVAPLDAQQGNLEARTDQQLAAARAVLDKERLERLKRNLATPDEPWTPEGRDATEPPTEADTAEKPKDAAGDKPTGDAKAEGEPADDDTLQPALSGERLKPDPRFARKRRPDPAKPDSANDPNAAREKLRDRQQAHAGRLDQARRAVESDQGAVERMLRQLEAAAAKASPQQSGQPAPMGQQTPASSPPDAGLAQAMQELQSLMQSRQMQQARQMAARAKQAGKGQPQGMPAPSPTGNLTGQTPQGVRQADLSKLDIQTRSVLLKLPPAVREEILQGMRDEGPEGYRRFVADYFRALSETEPKK